MQDEKGGIHVSSGIKIFTEKDPCVLGLHVYDSIEELGQSLESTKALYRTIKSDITELKESDRVNRQELDLIKSTLFLNEANPSILLEISLLKKNIGELSSDVKDNNKKITEIKELLISSGKERTVNAAKIAAIAGILATAITVAMPLFVKLFYGGNIRTVPAIERFVEI